MGTPRLAATRSPPDSASAANTSSPVAMQGRPKGRESHTRDDERPGRTARAFAILIGRGARLLLKLRKGPLSCCELADDDRRVSFVYSLRALISGGGAIQRAAVRLATIAVRLPPGALAAPAPG